MFTEFIDDSKSRVYVGLYVDDFIDFGDTPEVEAKFRSLMNDATLVTFKHDPTLFLGIKINKKPYQISNLAFIFPKKLSFVRT